VAYREDQKIQIQEATDLVSLIGEQVALRPKGREHVGLCPFHDDRNPSMYVNPQKQIYKCFVCGAGGDAYSFVMNYHKMTFPEALKYLAGRAGIELVRDARVSHDGAADDRKRIADANARALRFFIAMLNDAETGRVARQYIEQRGISDEMVERFQLGYAPDAWDALAKDITRKTWSVQGFLEAGLVSPRDKTLGSDSRLPAPDACYDKLRHRLIFPITDNLGRPIAFGGRKLRDEDEPKYLNSPETKLFNKSATLYGLHQAKKAIIDSKTAVVVEGYTDVIACHQTGACNVVATLGTALTAQHVRELRRYCEKVVLIFDADEAGQKAADRAVEIFLAEDLDVAIAVLPAGDDPDTLMKRSDGLARWNDVVAGAADALTYQFERVQEQMDAAGTVTGRQHLAEQYVQQLARLGLARTGSIRRGFVVRQLTALLGLPEATVVGLLHNAQQNQRPRRPIEPDAPAADEAPVDEPPAMPGVSLAEKHVIAVLMEKPELFHSSLSDGRMFDETITPADMVSAAAGRLYQFLYEKLADDQPVSLRSVLADLAERGHEDLSRLATACERLISPLIESHRERLEPLLHDAAQKLLRHHSDREYQQARQALASADRPTAGESETQLLRRINEQLKANPSPTKIAMVRN